MKSLKKSVKYLVALAVAMLLMWVVFRQVNLEEMMAKLKEVNYFYVGISMVIMVLAHWVRAYRWKLMLKPVGYSISTFRTFNAVLVGYIANLFLPRMGEVTRCGVLKKTDDVEVSLSFGTVVSERIIDALTLLFIIFLNFVLEYELLQSFFVDLFESRFSKISNNLVTIYFILGGLFVVAIMLYLVLRHFKARLKQQAWFLKVRHFLKQLVSGMMSIQRIENKAAFWASTVLMWSLYYSLTFVIFFSMPETQGLGLLAGLTVLVTGSIGMATPVQGGIGAVHVLISSVLVLYGIVLADGLLFATILHSSQMLGTIVYGGISLIVTVLLQKKRSTGELQKNHA